MRSLSISLKFFRCSAPLLSSVFRPYVERSQTVSVSLDRAEVAASLGGTTNLSRVESRRCHSRGTSVRPAPWVAGRSRERGTTPAEILHPRHVPLSVWRRTSRRTSRRLYRHGHPGSLQACAGVSRTASDGLGRFWFARRAIRHQ